MIKNVLSKNILYSFSLFPRYSIIRKNLLHNQKKEREKALRYREAKCCAESPLSKYVVSHCVRMEKWDGLD